MAGATLTSDTSRAEDVTQIALSKPYVAWFRVDGAHEAYARTIVARTAVNEVRRPLRREIPREVGEGRLPSDADEAAAVVARVTLRTALLALPLRQRQVVVRRH